MESNITFSYTLFTILQYDDLLYNTNFNIRSKLGFLNDYVTLKGGL